VRYFLLRLGSVDERDTIRDLGGKQFDEQFNGAPSSSNLKKGRICSSGRIEGRDSKRRKIRETVVKLASRGGRNLKNKDSENHLLGKIGDEPGFP